MRGRKERMLAFVALSSLKLAVRGGASNLHVKNSQTDKKLSLVQIFKNCKNAETFHRALIYNEIEILARELLIGE